MISLQRFFLLLAFFAVAFGQIEDGVTSHEEKPKIKSRTIVHEVNLNNAFDNSLPNIRRVITKNGFDPMDIPDIEVPLGPLPDLLKTKMHLHHGYMQELSTIYRTGDIILQYHKDKVSLYLNIGFETLDLSHEYTLRLPLYTRKGDCYGRYHNVRASMLVEFDLKNHKINLKFFKLHEVGDFKLRLEGHLTDVLLNIVSRAVTKLFRNQVLRVIEDKTYEEVDKMIEEINEMIPSPYNVMAISTDNIERYKVKDIVPSMFFSDTD